MTPSSQNTEPGSNPAKASTVKPAKPAQTNTGAPPAPGAPKATSAEENKPTSNFLRQIIERDLAQGLIKRDGTERERLHTRFPPEPNGYLHIGHAKSICLNFGLARDYGGVCHLRLDDTNPEKEEQDFVDAIVEAVRWLGFDWGQHYYHAADQFDKLYQCARALIQAGLAYVDEQSAEQIGASRGTLTEPGRASPWRERAASESLDLFARMKAGEFADGSMVLRAKIDMASPNINLRDPVLYRVRHAEHHRSGGAWCIYPLYDYAHPICDALEGVTHSICTLEFEDHRPLYDWLVQRLFELGELHAPLPHQYEFARLNLSHTMTSKRKLKELVESGLVDGWDDPRLPTLLGIRRRGYTPEAIRLFCERIGVAKADSWIEHATLEGALRDDLDERAPRAHAILHPLKLEISNYPADQTERCHAAVHPRHPERGERSFAFSRELWIEADDFMETPAPGYRRLSPGVEVRLRHAYIVRCTGCEKDAQGNIVKVLATYDPDTKSGTPGSARSVKGNIHWLSTSDAVPCEVRQYAPLFNDPQPDSAGRDWRTLLNRDSKTVLRAYVEPALLGQPPETHFQFERHGYAVTDRRDHHADKPVFNLAVTLKEGKKAP